MKKYPIKSREVLISSPYSPVEKHEIELPDGRIAEWYVNTSADAVVVIPVLKDGKVLLQRAYKHGGGEVITEFCAGLMDDGEVPEETARRELLEETGYSAGSLKFLGSCFANPTGSTMKYHFFLAEGCEKVAEQKLDDTEQIECFVVEDLEAAREVICGGSVLTSAASLGAISMINNLK